MVEKKIVVAIAVIGLGTLVKCTHDYMYENEVIKKDPQGEPWVETKEEYCKTYGYCYAYDFSKSQYRYHWNTLCDGKRVATREYQKYEIVRRNGKTEIRKSSRDIEIGRCER